jgi:hypothetical protein
MVHVQMFGFGEQTGIQPHAPENINMRFGELDFFGEKVIQLVVCVFVIQQIVLDFFLDIVQEEDALFFLVYVQIVDGMIDVVLMVDVEHAITEFVLDIFEPHDEGSFVRFHFLDERKNVDMNHDGEQMFEFVWQQYLADIAHFADFELGFLDFFKDDIGLFGVVLHEYQAVIGQF